MATRTAPSRTELITALQLPQPDASFVGVGWDAAVRRVRKHFKTNTAKATEWLDGVLDTSCDDIICVTTYGSYQRPGPTHGDLTELGWRNNAMTELRLEKLGWENVTRTPIGSDQHTDGFTGWMVMRRDTLDALRPIVEAEVAERARKMKEARQAEVTEFRRFHGDALDTIVAVVTEAACGDKPTRMIDADVINERSADFYTERFGDPCSLTIRLHGRQIRQFAALLRDHTQGPS